VGAMPVKLVLVVASHAGVRAPLVADERLYAEKSGTSER
jgi:hypothetical protein